MAILAKPLLKETVAFDATRQHTFYFSYVGGDVVNATRMIFTNPETEEVRVSAVYDNSNLANSYQFVLEPGLLENGIYYEAVIQTTSEGSYTNHGIWSEESVKVGFYCYETPKIYLTNIVSNQELTTPSCEFDFVYTQKEGEKLSSFYLQLFNPNDLSQPLLETDIIYIDPAIDQTSTPYKETYDNNTQYYLNDIVLYSIGGTPSLYLCTDVYDNVPVGTAPSNVAYWTKIVIEDEDVQADETTNWLGDWTSNTNYQKYDIVNYESDLYFALATTKGYVPSIVTTKWKKIMGAAGKYSATIPIIGLDNNATYAVTIATTTENGTVTYNNNGISDNVEFIDNLIPFSVSYVGDATGVLNVKNKLGDGIVSVIPTLSFVDGETNLDDPALNKEYVVTLNLSRYVGGFITSTQQLGAFKPKTEVRLPLPYDKDNTEGWIRKPALVYYFDKYADTYVPFTNFTEGGTAADGSDAYISFTMPIGAVNIEIVEDYPPRPFRATYSYESAALKLKGAPATLTSGDIVRIEFELTENYSISSIELTSSNPDITDVELRIIGYSQTYVDFRMPYGDITLTFTTYLGRINYFIDHNYDTSKMSLVGAPRDANIGTEISYSYNMVSEEYLLTGVRSDDVSVDYAGTQIEFTMPGKNIKVDYTIERNPNVHNIAYSVPTGISVTRVLRAAAGKSVTIRHTLSSGYQLKSVTGTSGISFTATSVTFTMPNSDVSLVYTVEQNNYARIEEYGINTAKSEYEYNGSTTIPTNWQVGSRQKIEIIPDNGYYISQYSFTDVNNANIAHTVTDTTYVTDSGGTRRLVYLEVSITVTSVIKVYSQVVAYTEAPDPDPDPDPEPDTTVDATFSYGLDTRSYYNPALTSLQSHGNYSQYFSLSFVKGAWDNTYVSSNNLKKGSTAYVRYSYKGGNNGINGIHPFMRAGEGLVVSVGNTALQSYNPANATSKSSLSVGFSAVSPIHQAGTFAIKVPNEDFVIKITIAGLFSLSSSNGGNAFRNFDVSNTLRDTYNKSEHLPILRERVLENIAPIYDEEDTYAEIENSEITLTGDKYVLWRGVDGDKEWIIEDVVRDIKLNTVLHTITLDSGEVLKLTPVINSTTYSSGYFVVQLEIINPNNSFYTMVYHSNQLSETPTEDDVLYIHITRYNGYFAIYIKNKGAN